MAGPLDAATNKKSYFGISVSGTIATTDGTPVSSPKTGVTTAPFAFIRPANAVTFTFRTTGDCRYGENATLDGTAGFGYKKASSGYDITIPCNSMTNIYVRAETGTIDVDFFFEILVF